MPLGRRAAGGGRGAFPAKVCFPALGHGLHAVHMLMGRATDQTRRSFFQSQIHELFLVSLAVECAWIKKRLSFALQWGPILWLGALCVGHQPRTRRGAARSLPCPVFRVDWKGTRLLWDWGSSFILTLQAKEVSFRLNTRQLQMFWMRALYLKKKKDPDFARRKRLLIFGKMGVYCVLGVRLGFFLFSSVQLCPVFWDCLDKPLQFSYQGFSEVGAIASFLGVRENAWPEVTQKE